VPDVTEGENELVIAIKTTASATGCWSCGMLAERQDRVVPWLELAAMALPVSADLGGARVKVHVERPANDGARRQLEGLSAPDCHVEAIRAAVRRLERHPSTGTIAERPGAEVGADAQVGNAVDRELKPERLAGTWLAELRPSGGKLTHDDLVGDRRIGQLYDAQIAAQASEPITKGQ
jgi:hypothetical protein